MKYTYKLTPLLLDKVQQLAIRREAIELIEPPATMVDQIRQQSLLRSALFSAKIEGNTLSEAEVFSGKSRQNLEVQQLLTAYKWVYRHHDEKLTLGTLKRFHQMSMLYLDETPGQFRTAQTAIFNQAGVAVYVPPPAIEVRQRLSQLLRWLVSNQDPAPIKAAVAHFWFEKIHPFIDGNGRVGRLLSSYILEGQGFGFKGMLSLEQVLEGHREDYYALLGQTGKDISLFAEFFVDCLMETSAILVETLKNIKLAGPEDNLRPRQREIYLILRDHPEVSFDFIARRFLAVPKSTLHYDLNQLTKKDLVVKIGTTRGVLYRLRSG